MTFPKKEKRCVCILISDKPKIRSTVNMLGRQYDSNMTSSIYIVFLFFGLK